MASILALYAKFGLEVEQVNDKDEAEKKEKERAAKEREEGLKKPFSSIHSRFPLLAPAPVHDPLRESEVRVTTDVNDGRTQLSGNVSAESRGAGGDGNTAESLRQKLLRRRSSIDMSHYISYPSPRVASATPVTPRVPVEPYSEHVDKLWGKGTIESIAGDGTSETPQTILTPVMPQTPVSEGVRSPRVNLHRRSSTVGTHVTPSDTPNSPLRAHVQTRTPHGQHLTKRADIAEEESHSGMMDSGRRSMKRRVSVVDSPRRLKTPVATPRTPIQVTTIFREHKQERRRQNIRNLSTVIPFHNEVDRKEIFSFRSPQEIDVFIDVLELGVDDVLFGTEAFKAGRFQDAVEIFESVMLSTQQRRGASIETDNGVLPYALYMTILTYNKAAALYHAHDYENALHNAHECLRKRPDWDKARLCYGRCLERLDVPYEAFVAYKYLLDHRKDAPMAPAVAKLMHGLHPILQMMPDHDILMYRQRYERFCAHCNTFTAQTYNPCPDCEAVFYCTRQCKDSDRRLHKDMCKTLRMALADAAVKDFIVYQPPQYSTLIGQFRALVSWEDIWKHRIHHIDYPRNMSHESYQRLMSEPLSYPLTMLYALDRFGILDRNAPAQMSAHSMKSLVEHGIEIGVDGEVVKGQTGNNKFYIHIMGATNEVEAKDNAAIYVDMLLLLPLVTHVVLVMVGPEITPRENVFYTACGNSLTVVFQQAYYHDYMKSSDYRRPEFVIGYHCGISPTWEQTLKQLATTTPPLPVVVTSLDRRVHQKSMHQLQQCVGDGDEVYVEFECRNKFYSQFFEQLAPGSNYVRSANWFLVGFQGLLKHERYQYKAPGRFDWSHELKNVHAPVSHRVQRDDVMAMDFAKTSYAREASAHKILPRDTWDHRVPQDSLFLKELPPNKGGTTSRNPKRLGGVFWGDHDHLKKLTYPV
eukprot:GFYU01004575.1.p1 GENE.GFYU01004575.1~~GFYU01004575.1.p1  ORF type:complete len:924 (-),score=205.61 GFYU01004575.1:105-2876(-)